MHVVHYPLRRGTEFNIVAVFRTESHAEKGDVASYRAELDRTYRDAHPAMRALIGLLDLRWRRAVADRNPVRHWHRGRVVLVGDAAHAPLQSYAQGAGMAIEDGLCLGELMAEEGDFTTAFKRFEAARILRTARLQLESRSLWDFFHLDEGLARDVRNATIADWDEARLFDCLSWLYDGFRAPATAAGQRA
jgi:salicylate hydroxylase